MDGGSTNDTTSGGDSAGFLIYTGYDGSMSTVRVITLVIACVGVISNFLMYFAASAPQKGSSSLGAAFMQTMAVTDSLTLVFTGLFSVGLSFMQSASLNGSKGLCRMKGFTSWYTLISMSLMLVLTTVDRVVAAWLPSLHKRVAGSSRLAWICYFTTCLLMTLVCGPLIPIHDVLFGMCLPANMDAMTEDEIGNYFTVILFVFVLGIPLAFIGVGAILLAISLCKGHTNHLPQDNSGGLFVMHKSLTVAHLLICVLAVVLIPVWFVLFSMGNDVQLISDKNIKYRDLMLLYGEMVICIMAATKFWFYVAASCQFRTQFLNNLAGNSSNSNNKGNNELHDSHEIN